MDKKIYSIYASIQKNWCSGCDAECKSCYVTELLENIKELDSSESSNEEGCFICLDKKGKSKDVFYDSGRGGLGVAIYCPNCGRKI